MIDVILGLRPQTAKQGATPVPWDDYWYQAVGAPTTAGIEVSEDTAMRFGTVFACVAKLAKTLASLPVQVREPAPRGTKRVENHWLERALSWGANDRDTGFELRESILASLLLWGNAYVYVIRNNREEIIGLQCLLPRQVQVKADDQGNVRYLYYHPNKTFEFTPEEIWHIKGLSFGELTGLSVVGYNRELIGAAMAVSQFGAAFFGNGTWMGGFLEYPEGGKELSQEGAQRLLDSIVERFKGAKHAFGLALLRDGIKFSPISMPLEDAQFLQIRQFHRTEICAMFDVPPSKIHDLERATFSNVEHQDIAWAKDSILPWAIRIEQSARKRFLADTGQFLKFNLAGLVRGDFRSRMEGYAIGRQWGIFSSNDCRELEDLDPIPGGDEYLTPLNMIGSTSREQDEKASTDWVEPLLADACDRIVAKETRAIQSAQKKREKDPAGEPSATVAYYKWVNTFFSSDGEHADYIERAVGVILAAASKYLKKELTFNAAEEYCKKMAGLLSSGKQVTPEERKDILSGIIRSKIEEARK